MVDVDWTRIARVAKSMGDEQNLLLLKTKGRPAGAVLDDAVPVDNGEGLANGGWFAGPAGWMLFIEGSEAQMKPWIPELADRLTAAGIEGILTGARTVGPPSWARTHDLMWGASLNAVVGYEPVDGFRQLQGWGCGKDVLERAVGHGIDWMCAQGGQAMANVNLQANFWVDPESAKAILAGQAATNDVSVSWSYEQQRQEVRAVHITSPGQVTLSSRAASVGWREIVDELRATLISGPLQQVSVAMVSHLSWSDYLMTQSPATAFFARHAYNRNPDRWQEFTLDPCGIQILTDQHLARANDLTAWDTTRLDERHYLLEAKDLHPWYAQPLRQTETVDPDLLAQSRADFGDMIFTHRLADDLNLA